MRPDDDPPTDRSPAVEEAPARIHSRRRRRRFMRATIEEGIQAELDAMTAEASGSPLFGDTRFLSTGATTEPTAPDASIADRLAHLSGKK